MSDAPAITLSMRIKWAFADAFVVAWRDLMKFVRIPALFVFSIVQPIMFVLLFRYVFAGNVTNLPGIDYVNYLLPGIFVQTAIFGSTATGIGLAEDLASGIVDRFRSLPMARSAVLTGRTATDLVRNVVVVLLMIGIGYLVGFSFENGFLPAVAAIGLTVSIGFAFSWISATIGLAIKEVESVQAASFTWVFPLTFVSSALVPLQGLASFLQPIARNNPVTAWANSVRVLTNGEHLLVTDPTLAGETLAGLIFKSTVWIVGIMAIFVPLAVRQYRKLT